MNVQNLILTSFLAVSAAAFSQDAADAVPALPGGAGGGAGLAAHPKARPAKGVHKRHRHQRQAAARPKPATG